MFALCPLAGRDRRHAHRDRGRSRISIHAPHAGRDKPCGKWYDGYGISIHAPREGRDAQSVEAARHNLISIHAPREGRDDVRRVRVRRHEFISIHAPHEGRDVLQILRAAHEKISIHAPHAGRDQEFLQDAIVEDLFQSTRPARGATSADISKQLSRIFQSTRPARGATGLTAVCWNCSTIFQSTRPARGATSAGVRHAQHRAISIHAPREGRDCELRNIKYRMQDISIHAPREGRDVYDYGNTEGSLYFNPRAPRGARPLHARQQGAAVFISIHAPREGRDLGRGL